MDDKYVVDTSFLINNVDAITNYPLVIHSSVLEELDNMKEYNDEAGYKARKAIQKILSNTGNFIFDNDDYTAPLPWGWSTKKTDNQLIACAKINKYKLLTDDISMRLKAVALGVEVEFYDKGDGEVYKGYKELFLTTGEINDLFASLEEGVNKYNFLENEYLILHNVDLNDVFEYRYSNGKLVHLKLPSSKVIKALNPLQRCALDLLNNDDIPVKVISGNYGAGKTMLAVRMGLYNVFTRGKYSKLFLIRNPIGAGEQIGFLPGSKYEKIKDYFRPIVQYLDRGIDDLDYYIKNEQIVIDIPYFLKGLSIQESFVIVDEAEDIDVKGIKLIGSRIDKNSAIVFCGDYNQVEAKYKNNNGLKYLIEKAKGNPLFGVITLEEDVRSEASKLFADL
ncbi:MAG: PhoH family protein [Candidatus Izemoplasmatales bacterium]